MRVFGIFFFILFFDDKGYDGDAGAAPCYHSLPLRTPMDARASNEDFFSLLRAQQFSDFGSSPRSQIFPFSCARYRFSLFWAVRSFHLDVGWSVGLLVNWLMTRKPTLQFLGIIRVILLCYGAQLLSCIRPCSLLFRDGEHRIRFLRDSIFFFVCCFYSERKK